MINVSSINKDHSSSTVKVQSVTGIQTYKHHKTSSLSMAKFRISSPWPCSTLKKPWWKTRHSVNNHPWPKAQATSTKSHCAYRQLSLMTQRSYRSNLIMTRSRKLPFQSIKRQHSLKKSSKIRRAKISLNASRLVVSQTCYLIKRLTILASQLRRSVMSYRKSRETKVLNSHTASLPSRITATWLARRPKARMSLQNRMDLSQIFQPLRKLRLSQVPTPCSQVRKHRSLSQPLLVNKLGISFILQRLRLTRGLLATSERAIWSQVRSQTTRELRMCLQSTVDS